MLKGLVFFDLDGTLLNGDSLVDQEVRDSLLSLKENGYEPIIATGRPLGEIGHILEYTGINSIVCMNGQLALFEGELLYDYALDQELLDRFIERVYANGDELTFYNREKIRLSGLKQMVVDNYREFNAELPEIDRNFYRENRVNMMLLFSHARDQEYMEDFPELKFVRNDPYSVDVFSKGISKATGIEFLREKIDRKDLKTYCFGDGMNDWEMFDQVDYAIAMENGVEALKEKADFVTSSNRDGGIVKALRKYKLI